MADVTLMTYNEIVEKLVGRIHPVGETNIDGQRFENLKEMCWLVGYLLTQIKAVHTLNKTAQEYSVKRAADYAKDFLEEIKDELFLTTL